MSYDRVFVKIQGDKIVIGYREDKPMPVFLGGPNAPKPKPLEFSIDDLKWLAKTTKKVSEKMFNAGGQGWGSYASPDGEEDRIIIQLRDRKIHLYNNYPRKSITLG